MTQRLQRDRATVRADGDDPSFTSVGVQDKDGNLCPLADDVPAAFALDVQ